MSVRIIGDHPLEKRNDGRWKSCIGTAFPNDRVLVTLPNHNHYLQRVAYLELLDQELIASGRPPLTDAERAAKWAQGVDLIMESQVVEWYASAAGEPRHEDRVFIRPDPDQMALAFAADRLLQELQPPIPVWQIRFLAVQNTAVHQAIIRRGQCWRIAPPAQSTDQWKQLIASSKSGLGGAEIYYYNKDSGTRYLTCQDFQQLADLDPEGLRRQLLEIQKFSAMRNAQGNPEVAFFLSGEGFTKEHLAGQDINQAPRESMHDLHRDLAASFAASVPPELRSDDVDDEGWRSRMVAALVGQRDEVVSGDALVRLSSEFFMQIHWLPGARFENSELLVDPCFEDPTRLSQQVQLCDKKTLGFIFNFVREYGALEYINIGRVVGSMSRHRKPDGRREVYIAVLKRSAASREVVRIIRMQKRGVCEHLDEGQSLLDAMLNSDRYTEYVLDRRLACRQLGMNLTQRILARKVRETYQGQQACYQGMEVLSPYFERDYIEGIATDKIPRERFQVSGYAVNFASLLGRAAAPNLIVGRCVRSGQVVFDDGDELVLESADGLPLKIIVSDQMGSFGDCESPLTDFAPAYAEPVNRRIQFVTKPADFTDAYLDGLRRQFLQIQDHYRVFHRAFDALFAHYTPDTETSIHPAWLQVLARLDQTNVRELVDCIRSHIQLPGS